jgi:ABC-type dipeptide/oligopeptide/nickel transport system ATPase component
MKLTNKQFISTVFNFSKPFRKTLFTIFGLIMAMTGIDALNSYFMSKVFDSIQEQTSLQSALVFCLLSLIMVTLRIILQRVREIIEIKKLDIHVSNHLNHQSITKFFTFSNGQHINEHSGVKQNIVTSGFSSIQNSMNQLIYNLIPHISLFIASMVIFFYVNFWIGIIYTIATSIYFTQMLKYNVQIQPRVKEINEIRNQNSRFISEIYRYVFLIKNEVAEKKTLTELSDSQDNLYKSHVKTWMFGIPKLMWIRLVPNIFRYVSMLLGVYFLFKGSVTLGGLFLIFTWSGHFINSLWWLAEIQKTFITDKVNIEKYFELLGIEPDIKNIDNPITLNNYSQIEFKNVVFSYPKRSNTHGEESDKVSNVLKSISFKINSGEKVAFVGESGSGKSTIANLIRRAFDPQSGEIIINGEDLKSLDINSYLKSIGSVDQEVVLFDRTVRENISIGSNRLLSDDELNSIAKLSGIDKFHNKLEHGWDTIIGERGCKISGGERQRIGIARALSKNPDILIFDESTSALDSVSESIVQKSIDISCQGKTSIIIAHRLSTVKNCDRIFVMKDGQIICSGKHRQLMKSCEYYNDLIQHQLQEVDLVEK